MLEMKLIDKSRAKKKQTIKGTGNNEEIYGSKYADKIFTGAGYDVIDPGKGKDTIIVNGSGEKRINIDGFSSNTIKFSGDMSNTKVSLDVYYGFYTYRKSGTNLYIDGFSWENGKKTTQTIVNFFGNEGSVPQELYIKEEDDEEEYKIIKDIFGLKIYGDKKRNVVGTNNDDSDSSSYYGEYLIGSKKADNIYTGTGLDYIIGGKGNDKIYLNGAGSKEIIILNGDGNDTIYVDDTTTNFNIITPGTVDITKSLSADGNDLTLYRTYDSGKSVKTEKTVIKDYYKYPGASLFINGYGYTGVPDEDKNKVLNMKKTYTIDSTETKTRFLGTKKADNITVDHTGDAAAIFTGLGNDTITVNSSSWDMISAGKGNDRINIATDKGVSIFHSTGEGNDTISAVSTHGTIELNINVQAKAFNDYIPYYSDYFISSRQGLSINGNDLVIQIPSGMNKFETITFKDYNTLALDKIQVNMSINGNEHYNGNLSEMMDTWALWANGVYDSTSKRTIYDYVDGHDTNFYYGGKGKSAMYGNSNENCYIANFNKKSNLIISDYDTKYSEDDSEYDMLLIKSSKNNLRAFFNVDKNGRVYVTSSNEKSDDFFIFNKANLTAKNVKAALNGNGTGFIDMDNYFKYSSGSTFVTGAGFIENILVGKNVTDKFAQGYAAYIDLEMKCYVDTDEWISNIASDVAGWLSKHTKYSDAMDVIQNGSSKDIASLLKVYAGEKPVTYDSMMSGK